MTHTHNIPRERFTKQFRFSFVLFNDTWSVRTFGVMYDHAFSKTCKSPDQTEATHKVDCQPGDCIWSLQFSSGVCEAV